MRLGVACAVFGLLALIGVLLAVGVGAQSPPITLEERTTSSLSVRWHWGGQTAAAFEVAWRPRGEDDRTAWRSARKRASERRHTIGGLDAGVHYVVRVRALNAAGRPLGDLRAAFATDWSAPRLLRVTARADAALTIGWSAPNDWSPQGYRLRWRAAGAQTLSGDLTLPASADSRRLPGLSTGTAYLIRLTALNARGGESPPAVLTATAGAPPAQPVLTDASWSELTLRAEWDAVARATGYDVRWSSADDQTPVSAEEAIETSPAEYIAPRTGLYTVAVRARIGSGPSAVRGEWSQPLSLRLLPAPHYLRVQNFDGERVRLSWPGVGANGYVVEWGRRGGTKQTETRDGRSGVLEVGPLTAIAAYEFRVRARHQRGESGWSPTATMTPTVWPQLPPRAALNQGSLYVLWPPAAGAEWYEAQWINAADRAETARVRVAPPGGGGNVAARIGRDGGFEDGRWLVRVRAGPFGLWSQTYALDLAGQPPRLALELESSRDLCTAGTLTEVSWKISGGSAPYALSVENSVVDVSADNVRINCGALTEAESGDAEAALAAKTVTATVTDSRGVQRQAALDVDRARALPAPVGTPSAWPVTADAMAFAWAGARGLAPCDPDALFAVRWRRATASDWHHAFASATGAGNCDVWKAIGDVQEDTAYDAAIAALRHPIELSTPRALRWTRANQARAVTTPSGVTAAATHDTITVRWNRQSTAFGYHVGLSSPNGGASAYLSRHDELAWGDPASGTHEFVFRNLPADTPFTVSVVIPTPIEHPRRLSAKTQVRTTTLPSGQHPLLRGPQNLRATATADSIAVRWDAPFSGADAEYKVTVYHPRYPSKPLIEWAYRNEFSQGDLESGLTYRVVVEHQGIVRAAAEIEVTTTAPTAAGAAADTPTTTSPPPWPAIQRLPFVWPTALKATADNWSVLTDDVWVSGTFRPHYWHGGVDIGVPSPRNGYRQLIQAIAGGYVHEYTPMPGQYVLYCPGSSTEDSPHAHIQLAGKNDQQFKVGSVTVPCTQIASWYHGRVAVTTHVNDGTIHVVLYAHLSRFASGTSAAGKRTVKAGEVIGIEGASGGPNGCISDGVCPPYYDLHLHLTIREFSRDDTSTEVAKVKGDSWRQHVPPDGIERAWTCGPGTVIEEYCNDGPNRAIKTVLDPEVVFPPAPPATTPTAPGAGEPSWSGTGQVEHDVNNQRKRFLVKSVKAGIDGKTHVELDIAAWRPHLYTSTEFESHRDTTPGVAGTRDGVEGYYASAGDCGEIVASEPDDKITFAITASGRAFWSEVEPMALKITIGNGDGPCDVSVGSYNDSYPPGATLPDGAYGRDRNGVAVQLGLPTAQVSMYGTVLEPSGAETPIHNESLAAFEFRLYEFEAIVGHTYEFKTDVGGNDDVVLDLWRGGRPLKSTANGAGAATLTWKATASGTAHVVARGGINTDETDPKYGQPWTGTYGLTYSKTSPLRLTASSAQSSCYSDRTISVSWSVTGGVSPYTVSVGTTTIALRPGHTSGSTSVACRLGEVRVSVTDDADSSRSKRVTWTVKTRTVVDPGTPTCPSGLECLSSRQPASHVTWQACCTAVQASWLVDQLPRVCGIFLSRNGQRLIYGKTTSGIEIPGSEDFTIRGGDRPWLYGCASSSAPSASPPGASGTADDDFLDE